MQKIFTQLSRLYNSTIFISLIGVIGIIALLSFSLFSEYREVHKQAQVEVENISRLMEEHVSATILKCDLITREIQRNMHPEDMRSLRGEIHVHKHQLHALLKSQVESMPELAVLHIANAQGNYIYSSLDEIPNINIADREYFKRQSEDATVGLFISAPLLSRTTGKWTISLSRRLNYEDGSFAGLINVILNLEYFQQFYRSLDMGAQGQVSLFDKDLHLAARYPPSDKNMGQIANLKARAL